MLRHFPLGYKCVPHVAPRDINGAAQGGNYNFISLRNYAGICARIVVGAHSSTAVAVTLQQAKNVEGNGAKALGFTLYYSNSYLASPVEDKDKVVEQTAASDTFNIAANTQYFIPVRQAMLDVDNAFDCVRIVLAAGAASTIVFWEWVLWQGPNGIVNDMDHTPSVHVNRMPN